VTKTTGLPGHVRGQSLDVAKGYDHVASSGGSMRKRLLCRLRKHGWVKKVSAGLAYYECRYCGKYRDPIQTGLPIFW
jgi:hypothetical protein